MLRNFRFLKSKFLYVANIDTVCGEPWEKCHRFWLRLRHALILISNDRTSASKKINGMALIRTLMDSITALERTKENSTVFGRLDKTDGRIFKI